MITTETMNLLAIGNLNKRYSLLMDKLSNKGINNTLLVCTGSLGVRNEQDFEKLIEFNKFLHAHNNTLYSIRGCFDNADFFDNTYIMSNIVLVKDFNVYQKVLFIGGGIPLDRSIPNRPEVPLPKLTNSDLRYISELRGTIDVLVVHQAPSLVNQSTALLKAWAKYDATLIEDHAKFAARLTYIIQHLEPKTCFFSGNSHFEQRSPITKFVQLNPLQVYGEDYN